jgi:hypothetical protein
MRISTHSSSKKKRRKKHTRVARVHANHHHTLDTPFPCTTTGEPRLQCTHTLTLTKTTTLPGDSRESSFFQVLIPLGDYTKMHIVYAVIVPVSP